MTDISCPSKKAAEVSQELLLLEYLQDRKEATTKSIVQDLGFCSPTKLISKLRKQGIRILDKWVTGISRFGSEVRYKVYYLEEE